MTGAEEPKAKRKEWDVLRDGFIFAISGMYLYDIPVFCGVPSVQTFEIHKKETMMILVHKSWLRENGLTARFSTVLLRNTCNNWGLYNSLDYPMRGHG